MHFALASDDEEGSFFSMIEQILILDFGSQYTQVIARRIRECKVYSTIVPYHISTKEIASLQPKGLILSGGPSSVYAPKAPFPDRAIFNLPIPILGICYGVQLMAHFLGGKVAIGLREIADRDDLSVAMFEERAEHLVAAVAQPDESNPHAIVRAVHAAGAERRDDAGRGRSLGEVSASDVRHVNLRWDAGAVKAMLCKACPSVSGGRIGL